jgi:hypothetical protein
MATLDVGWVLADPAFSDSFQVRRYEESTGSNGRISATQTQPLMDASGSVQPAEPMKLQREDDQDYVVAVIEIITSFALRSSSMGFKPDVVIWNGGEYAVTSVNPYRFGSGFFECVAMSEHAPESPP